MNFSIFQRCLATQPQNVDNTVFALARQSLPAYMELPEGRLVRARSWLEVASCDIGAWAALRCCREAAEQSDIIQNHYPWPFADMLRPFIQRRNQPVVVTDVSDIVRQKDTGLLYAPLRRCLLGRAMRIGASSPNYAACSEILQEYQGKLTCIPHCLGEIAVPTAQLRTRRGSELGRNFFLFISVLRYFKGLNFLLAAASQAKAVIVVVREGWEGERLRHEAAAKRLSNVHLLGTAPDGDKQALYSLCRGVDFPSHLRSEAFGMTLLEGAQAAKSLICCGIGASTIWINRHHKTGLGARDRWRQFFTLKVVGAAHHKLYGDLPMV
jgi:glycosyltransferase involved in cell wall biosynthesis